MDHQRKGNESASREQYIVDEQTTANCPPCEITQMGNIDRMAHARVHACCDQFLNVFAWPQLGFAGEFVPSKFGEYPAICLDCQKEERQSSEPGPQSRIQLNCMPRPGQPS